MHSGSLSRCKIIPLAEELAVKRTYKRGGNLVFGHPALILKKSDKNVKQENSEKKNPTTKYQKYKSVELGDQLVA